MTVAACFRHLIAPQKAVVLKMGVRALRLLRIISD